MSKTYRYRLSIDQYRLLAKYVESNVKAHELDDMCILEIGSRDAADAFLLSCLLSHNHQIIAFDPHSRFIELASPFARLNPNLILENIAIGSYTGNTKFYATDTTGVVEKCDDTGIGASSIKEPILDVPGLPTQAFNELLVPCITGKDYCDKNARHPRVLILDVQGAEIEVLRSFGKYLNEVNLIFTEFNIDSGKLYKNDAHARALLDFLQSESFLLVKCYGISQYAADGIFVNVNAIRRNEGHAYLLALKLDFLFSIAKLFTLTKLRRAYCYLRNVIKRGM